MATDVSDIMNEFEEGGGVHTSSTDVSDILSEFEQAPVDSAPKPSDVSDILDQFEESQPPETDVSDILGEFKEAPRISPAIKHPPEAKIFDKTQVQKPDDRGFFDSVGESFKRGSSQIKADIATGRGLAGTKAGIPEVVGDPLSVVSSFAKDLTDEDISKLQPLIQKQMDQEINEFEDPIEGKNILSKGIFAASKMLGGMFTTMASAWDDALAGAVAGSVIPGAGTVAGAKIGFTAGTAKEWYFQGAGQMYRDFISDGIDPESAKNASMIAAAPYAAIEFAFTRMPGLKGVFHEIGRAPKEVFKKGALAIAKNVIKQHGISTLGEITEEGAQELTQNIARNVAGFISNKATGSNVEAREAKEVISRVVKTMTESAIPIALTMAPSASFRGIQAAYDFQKLKGQEEQSLPEGVAQPETGTPESQEAAEPELGAPPVGDVAPSATPVTDTGEAITPGSIPSSRLDPINPSQPSLAESPVSQATPEALTDPPAESAKASVEGVDLTDELSQASQEERQTQDFNPEKLGNFQKFFTKMWAYGSSLARAPKIGKKAFDANFDISTSAQRAKIQVTDLLNQMRESVTGEDSDISIAMEQSQFEGNLDPRQKSILDKFSEVRETYTKMEEQGGTLGNRWPASAIAAAESEINSLRLNPDRTNAETAKLNRLEEDTLPGLKQFDGWMPRGFVARAVIESIYRDSGTEGVKKFKASLDTQSKQRKGKSELGIKDYIEMGLVTKDQANPARLMMDMIMSSQNRLAIKSFIDFAKGEGAIQNTKTAPKDSEWMPASSMGVNIKGLENQSVHVIVADAIRELANADRINKSAFDKALAITKVGQFFVPGIIWSYNTLQRHQGGLAELNPVKALQQFNEARKIFFSGTAVPKGKILSDNELEQRSRNAKIYSILIKYGLAQTPGMPTQKTSEEVLNVGARQLRSDINRSTRFKERLVGKQTATMKEAMVEIAKDPRKLLDAVMIPYRATGTVTWAGDEIQRIESYLKFANTFFKDRKWVSRIAEESTGTKPTAQELDFMMVDLKEMDADSEIFDIASKEAADKVSRIHGAYALFSPKMRQFFQRIFFVHTFRILMPTQIAKYSYGLPKMMLQKVIGNKDFSRAEWAQASKSFATTMALPVVIHGLMTANGWEPDDEGIPEWVKRLQAGKDPVTGKLPMPIGLPFPTYKNHWKYKKNFVTPEGENREIVVGVSTILNMPIKWIERFTKDRPEKLTDATYHAANLLKWEINPLYRIAFDAATNESSMGGKRPRDPKKSILTQTGTTSLYALTNIFRLYGEMLRTNNDSSYRRKVKKDLEGSLNVVEKVLLGYFTGYTKTGKFVPATFGYAYSRKERRARFGSALRALKSAISQEKRVIKSELRDDPEEVAKQNRELNAIFRERKRRLQNIFLGD